MKKGFLQDIREHIILADGATGTEIYSRGVYINQCYDELNLKNPNLIYDIHNDYINAGSRLIETNTFTSNRLALAKFGLEDKVAEINKAGVKIAQKASQGKVYVAGSVGPIRWAVRTKQDLSDKELESIYKEQISALVEAGCDAIIFETFLRLEELHVAYLAAKKICNLPIITMVSFKYISEEDEFHGLTPEDAACAMDSWGADVIGANCSDGPQGVYEAIKRMAKVTKKPLSAMPNAGLPKMVSGRLHYLASPDYFGEYAKRYAQLGVSLIGGCCGTKAKHIKEMHKFLKAFPTLKQRSVIETCVLKKENIIKIDPAEKSEFGAKLNKKFAISVEIDPPLGTDPQKAIEGAKYLKDLGIDAINIADGPRAMARMSPIALGKMIKEQVGIETIVHYCCRDRNLLGMQMDLIGADAMGLKNVLLVTGDPPKMGNYPHATAVFDIDSISLIHFVSNLNQGRDFTDRPIKGATKLLIGCGVNPGAPDLDLETERYKKKVLAGAEFVFSQPVFDSKLLEKFFSKIKDIPQIPFFVGILPLFSLRNAEFLHNEVPGMQIPKNIFNKMQKAKTKEAQAEIGINAAKEALAQAKELPQIKGTYIFPPLGNYKLVSRLLEG